MSIFFFLFDDEFILFLHRFFNDEVTAANIAIGDPEEIMDTTGAPDRCRLYVYQDSTNDLSPC